MIRLFFQLFLPIALLAVISAPGRADESGISASLVFIIHEDNDYLYHDSKQNRYNAGEEAFRDAESVAAQCKGCEVFVFRQKKKLISYYYSKGQLQKKEKSKRHIGQSPFQEEADFYRMNVKGWPETRALTYYGHHIPENARPHQVYSQSFPDQDFTIHEFESGLNRFSSRFDLVVLSTCNGATPLMLSRIAPFTDYVIASPTTIHLSYLDVEKLKQIDEALDYNKLNYFQAIAQDSFFRQQSRTLTPIVVGLYSMDRLKSFFQAFPMEIYGHTRPSEPYIDCADRPDLSGLDYPRDAVQVFYQAPRFGKGKDKRSHSGWGCPQK